MIESSESAGRGPDSLFARARAGDQDAWEELFRTCYPKVIRVVRRKLNPPMRSLYDSADFASDVWKSLAAKFDRFDFPTIDSLMAFLKQAAEQKVIDEYRRRHTQKRDIGLERPIEATTSQGLEPTALRSAEPTPSQVAQASEGLELILEGLTEDQRRVVHLKRHGYTNEEIAERTGWHVRKVQRFIKDLQDSWLASGGVRR
jgi:RNA polymerase sigma factor (sigma-70 family)